MHLVILGCGRSGSALALIMSEKGHQVTVIDIDSTAFTRLGKRHKCQVVVGDGLDEDTLQKASLQGAAAFVSCTKGDNTNLMVAQMARELYGVKRVGAKVNDPVRADAYRNQGIFTVTPGAMVAGLWRDWLTEQPSGPIDQYNAFLPELQQLMSE